ncbi:hypothetical protein F2P81_016875, partial [Scophthalmus maximus]
EKYPPKLAAVAYLLRHLKVGCLIRLEAIVQTIKSETRLLHVFTENHCIILKQGDLEIFVSGLMFGLPWLHSIPTAEGHEELHSPDKHQGKRAMNLIVRQKELPQQPLDVRILGKRCIGVILQSQCKPTKPKGGNEKFGVVFIFLQWAEAGSGVGNGWTAAFHRRQADHAASDMLISQCHHVQRVIGPAAGRDGKRDEGLRLAQELPREREHKALEVQTQHFNELGRQRCKIRPLSLVGRSLRQERKWLSEQSFPGAVWENAAAAEPCDKISETDIDVETLYKTDFCDECKLSNLAEWISLLTRATANPCSAAHPNMSHEDDEYRAMSCICSIHLRLLIWTRREKMFRRKKSSRVLIQKPTPRSDPDHGPRESAEVQRTEGKQQTLARVVTLGCLRRI